ncbi:MAG: IS30 family transposase [Candidatus Moranbacteria bacterium]|nr:IS30 family transposase [Candidatus Moranbacteria bacterium]
MYKHFTIEEREIVQELLWEKQSVRTIARTLSRSPSSVSREIKRHRTKEKRRYTPRVAHEQALKSRRSRGRNERLKNKLIRNYVVEHLKLHWSPEQIAGRMKSELGEKISHEAIYQYIYAQIHRDGYGYLKPGREDLRSYLRWKRKRRQHQGLRKSQKIPKFEGISIDARPKVVEERKRLGDWEGDTVESRDHKPGINTLVERKSGYVFMTKLNSKSGESTLQAVLSRISALPEKLRKTLTLDNGPENSSWRALKAAAEMNVYFAHPYHSWERGTNENTNGLIREYFPKKTDFSMIKNEEIAEAEYSLNTRPRKRLNWKTPLEIISVALQG